MADISQFQPLFPKERVLGPLQELAAEVIGECHTLRGLAGESMVRALSPRLRAMNSYYTNKIEGQHTKPAEIERALKNEFNADTALAKKQRIAVAHMEVEQGFETALGTSDAQDIFFPQVVCDIHRSLYSKLPESDRFTDDGAPIVPGGYRTQDVTAGRHLAPKWSEVDELLVGWAERYRTLAGTEALLIGVACSHHRAGLGTSVHRRERARCTSPYALGVACNETHTGLVVAHARACTYTGAVLREALQCRCIAPKRFGWTRGALTRRACGVRHVLSGSLFGPGALHARRT